MKITTKGVYWIQIRLTKFAGIDTTSYDYWIPVKIISVSTHTSFVQYVDPKTNSYNTKKVMNSDLREFPEVLVDHHGK